MREVIYKAQRADGKGWVEGYYAKWQGSDLIFPLTPIGRQQKVIPETVCQFWKISKKAGKLFEGDKVKVQGSKKVGVYESEIIFDGTMFKLKENKTVFIDSACFVGIIEVIGNVHDQN